MIYTNSRKLPHQEGIQPLCPELLVCPAAIGQTDITAGALGAILGQQNEGTCTDAGGT